MIQVKAPWPDEGWFICPSFHIAFRGFDGSPPVEPTGHYIDKELPDIQRRTLIMPPLHLYGLAAWMKVVGSGLTSARAYGLLWGCLGLGVLGFLAQWTWRRRNVTLLAMALTAVDIAYLWGSSDVRMDVPTAVLGWGAWAAWLLWRRRHLERALWAANSLVALSVLHHPNAIYLALPLYLAILMVDRRRLRWSHLLTVLVPAILAAGFWAWIIHPDWEVFRLQFSRNAAGRGNIRTRYLFEPWNMALYEVYIRYLANYGMRPTWLGEVPLILLAVPAIYAAIFAGMAKSPRRLFRGRTGVFALLSLGQIGLFTFLMSFKAMTYLVFLSPLWNVWLARSLGKWWERGGQFRGLAVALGCIFVLAQSAAIGFKYRLDERHQGFEAAHRFLDGQRQPGQTLWAPAYWGAESDFTGYREDFRWGFHTGQRADWRVEDRWQNLLDELFHLEEPAVERHIQRMRTEEYELAWQQSNYRIWRRRPLAKQP